jgi:ABC-type nickel/cobalt efflux system permease component RcnA
VLLALVLACVAATLAGGPGAARAEDASLVHWDALAPSTEPYDDPFLDMSYDQLGDLREVLEAQEAEARGWSDLGLTERAGAARERLVAAGLDPDDLLRQRLVVMERREEEATGVAASLVDTPVRIDGYVLPLAAEGERVVEFLLVPWVGACIHTPPPPPNPIVHVSYPEGLMLERRFEGVRLEGTLRHRPVAHELFLIDGTRTVPASYALDGAVAAGEPGRIEAESTSAVPLLTRVQIWVNTLFTTAMARIGTGGSVLAGLSAVLLAFGYGALHTLGPGHGKAVVISYFVGTGGSLRRGLTMGARIAVFHVISAIVVVFLLDFTVRQTKGAAPSDYRLVRLFSYGLIVAIGAAMLWQAVRALRAASDDPPPQGHAHGHAGHDHGSCAACDAQAARGGGWIAVAVGVVPCTGALIVMLFGLANDLVWQAILMVAAISLGMAVAMAALGVAALWGRGWAERTFASDDRGHRRFATGARLVGASCVLALGGALFAATLFHAPAEWNEVGEVAAEPEALLASGG